MKIIGVIPARYKSSRFPGKPLVDILGVPMVIRVARIVAEALGKENTYIATEDERIESVGKRYGFRTVMTGDDCLTGTDRIWEVAQKVKADIYINVQGDEPVLNPKDIIKIALEKKRNQDFVINGMISLSAEEDPQNVNIPKVLVNKANELLYISRLAIPGIKDSKVGKPSYKKQVCIYAFTYNELQAFGAARNKADYEMYEDIEILRFFDLGIKIKMVETSSNSLAVDVQEDVLKVIDFIKSSS